jgi:hypothetical protein
VANAPPVEEEVIPQVDLDGYINYKVDFNENLSEAESNSWGDDASMSESEEEEGEGELVENYYDEEAESPVKRKKKKKKKKKVQVEEETIEKTGVVDQTTEKEVSVEDTQIEEADQPQIEAEDGNKSDNSFSAADKKKKLVMNCAQTEYEVIKKVGRKVCNFRMKSYEEDHEGAIINGVGGQKLSPVWDFSWHDLSITPDFLSKMLPYQKVNMYPGIYCISRKNHLARNLMRMS